MAKTLPAVTTRVKDTAPELDDVRSIVLQNREAPTEMDLRLIEGMASHLIPAEEICSIIRVSQARFNKHLEYQQAYHRGVDLGKASLRRMQMVSAKAQPVMQIWLGKQHLGQADKVEAPQGESQLDAYKGFLDKLNLTINVHTAGKSAPTVVGSGKGDSETLLDTVGKGPTITTESRTVAGAAENEGVDRRVAEAQPTRDIHRLLEDVVVPSGSGQRENKSGSPVGSESG